MAPKTTVLTVEAATEAHAAAEAARDDLLTRARRGEQIQPMDLALADAAITLAESHVTAAHDAVAAAIETARLGHMEAIRAEFIDAYDATGTIAADLDAAIEALTRAIAAAHNRRERLIAATRELMTMGPLPEGDRAAKVGYYNISAQIDGRTIETEGMQNSATALAAEVAVTAITNVGAIDQVGNQLLNELRRFGTPSANFRTTTIA